MVDDHDEATQLTVVPRYGHPAIGSGQYIDSGRNKLRQRQHGHVDSRSIREPANDRRHEGEGQHQGEAGQ
jgi:hypothetical protein